MQKLLLALQLYNTYFDEPNAQKEDLFDQAAILKKNVKITKATWPGEDNVDEYTWIDEEGNLHLRSIEEDVCQIVLSSNCLHVRVSFLYLLPTKKAEWTYE